MNWTSTELEELMPILGKIAEDLRPLQGKKILVLCSAKGDVALWLGAQVGPAGRVIGLELDEELLTSSQHRAQEAGLKTVQFQRAERKRIPFPDGEFDAVVSEFILFPTPKPTEIGQPEMARVLRPGGALIVTDVVTIKPIPEEARNQLRSIGLDYVCEATPEDFLLWMRAAGLVNVTLCDFTALVTSIWRRRKDSDPDVSHEEAYTILLEKSGFRLGETLFYIYVRGNKP